MVSERVTGTCNMNHPDRCSEEAYKTALNRLLNEADGGEAAAALLPVVYDQLRRLAASKMREQAPPHTLQATALGHEAYLRLEKRNGVRKWSRHGIFFAAAAQGL